MTQTVRLAEPCRRAAVPVPPQLRPGSGSATAAFKVSSRSAATKHRGPALPHCTVRRGGATADGRTEGCGRARAECRALRTVPASSGPHPHSARAAAVSKVSQVRWGRCVPQQPTARGEVAAYFSHFQSGHPSSTTAPTTDTPGAVAMAVAPPPPHVCQSPANNSSVRILFLFLFRRSDSDSDDVPGPLGRSSRRRRARLAVQHAARAPQRR